MWVWIKIEIVECLQRGRVDAATFKRNSKSILITLNKHNKRDMEQGRKQSLSSCDAVDFLCVVLCMSLVVCHRILFHHQICHLWLSFFSSSTLSSDFSSNFFFTGPDTSAHSIINRYWLRKTSVFNYSMDESRRTLNK